MKVKNITLDLETAKNLWKSENSDIRKLIISAGYTQEEMEPKPISINDIRRDSGYIFSSNFREVPVKWKAQSKTITSSVPVFIGEKECMSAIAFEQLGWLMKEYNKDWKPNWYNTKQEKFAISRKFGTEHDYIVYEARYEYNYLVFKTREIAEQFLKDQIEVIINYFIV